MTRHFSIHTDDAAPLCERIKHVLLSRIGGEWMVGDRIPSVDQLCKQLGTGRSNTWRALRALVREGVLVSRQGRGTFVKRLPSARDLVSHRESIPGPLAGKRVLIRRSLADYFMLPAVDTLAESLELMGATVRFVSQTELEPKQAGDGAAIDAIVFINGQRSLIHEAGARCKLMVDSADPWSVDVDWDCDVVGTDSVQGGRLAGEALRRAGCKRVAILGTDIPGYGPDITCVKRVRGFEDGFGERVPAALMLNSEAYQSGCGAGRASDFVQLNPRPDGVFAVSDDLAYGFIHGAMALGLRAGHDYQIVGFDGQERLLNLQGGPATCVCVPTKTLGRLAAPLLAHRLQHPDTPSRRVSVDLDLLQGVTTRVPDGSNP